MEIKCISGFSVITRQPAASASLYKEALGLPLERLDDYPDYLFVDKFPGANHFGVWPLKMAANPALDKMSGPLVYQSRQQLLTLNSRMLRQ